jgi:uncharacterized protein YlzI (FlbEa/FlbD family)
VNKFRHIEQKLNAFIKKYYTNELIKGLILFVSFGLLYFIFTLFIEYFLWLKPTARTILFWTFIAIELALLVKYIIVTLIKLFGLQKGISYKDASKIIGKYFNEVDDKLLNVIQLHDTKDKSELLLASIEQKSIDLEPIPFKRAIKFSNNKKYLKYLAIPLLIWFITFITGNNIIFKDSLERVVNYQTAYEPPAPFQFLISNDKLIALEGKPFTINVLTKGDVVPENVKIYLNDTEYFLKEERLGNFSHTFSNLKEDIDFYIEANGVQSRDYHISVVKTPTINKFELFINYPKYTLKTNEKIKNTGNAIVPEGTIITWKVNAKNTTEINLKNNVDSTSISFKKELNSNIFRLNKRLSNHLDYNIKTSNNQLKDYEDLAYSIQVIKDEYPKIIIKTDIDSISRGNAQFIGQISDDYGIKKLLLVYYDKTNSATKKEYAIPVKKNTFQEFYYVFPEHLNLTKGIDYEFYFELFDNDGVNGNKSVKSKVYNYRNKTDKELNEDILKEQKQSLEDFNKATKKTEKINKSLEDFSKKMKSKAEMDWQDKKEFKQFLKRQKQYQQMLENNTQKLQNNIDELKNEDNPNLEQKKEDLKKRLEEMKEMQKKEKLLDELKKLAEKLDKENFLKKLDKLTQQNKQNEKSLERILELTKRFYVEKKAEEIANKLQELAKKQEELAKSKENTAKKQKELNKEFEKIKKEMAELQKQNKELKKPMDIPKKMEEQKAVDEDMQKAEEKLEESEQGDQSEEQQNEEQQQSKQSAQKKQKSAAKKMKKMSGEMQQAMMSGSGEMMEEDIDNLRAIIENLIRFSLEQEDLMDNFYTITAAHPEYSKKLKFQQVLKEHFEHIDDSIYSLSLRNPKISEKLTKDIVEAHYNLNQSLQNIADNKIKQALLNQQTTMMSANNLANYLSDVLDNEQNPSMGQGKGQGKGKGKGKGQGKGKGFQLSDIIKKQGEMLEQAKKGKKGDGEKGKDGKGEKGKSGKNGKGSNGQGEGENTEQMNGEMYEIYKQQNALKQAFKDMMQQAGAKVNAGNKALKQMEDLEKELLDKGLTQSVLQKMENLKHELLKLDKAAFEQGEDNKRKSETNKTNFKKQNIKEIKSKKLFFNPNEILNRQALPFKTHYKKKVQEYFSTK